MRKTKIVATIGPATHSAEMIRQLIAAGVDVIRLNFSHGRAADHAVALSHVRRAAAAAGRVVAILQDLQGPKIRTGMLAQNVPVMLMEGQDLVITTAACSGSAQRVSTTYAALPQDVHPGDRILLSDGLIALEVLDSSATEVKTRVLNGGLLKEYQGINLPGVALSAPALTEKDRTDLSFGLEHGVDYITLSFVRQASDIAEVKALMQAQGVQIPVVAKIERAEALQDLPAILDLADAIMVARGDLGVEMPPEEVPVIQKQLIEAANEAALPVITATQMLESMIQQPRPTRAEVSDVANAIIDGSDAIMLSAETAIGAHPLAAVEMMVRIAKIAETSGRHGAMDKPRRWAITPPRSPAQAIAAAARTYTEQQRVAAICVFTLSGETARLVAHQRPRVPILAFTPSQETLRKMALFWGVIPMLTHFTPDAAALWQHVKPAVRRLLQETSGQVLLIGGHPFGTGATTNLIKIQNLDGDD